MCVCLCLEWCNIGIEKIHFTTSDKKINALLPELHLHDGQRGGSVGRESSPSKHPLRMKTTLFGTRFAIACNNNSTFFFRVPGVSITTPSSSSSPTHLRPQHHHAPPPPHFASGLGAGDEHRVLATPTGQIMGGHIGGGGGGVRFAGGGGGRPPNKPPRSEKAVFYEVAFLQKYNTILSPGFPPF